MALHGNGQDVEGWRTVRRAVATLAAGAVPEHAIEHSSAPFTTGLAGVDTDRDSALRSILLGTMGAAAAAVLLVRLQQLTQGHLRHLATIRADKEQQAYFSQNHSRWAPRLKKHLTYAPLWRRRHLRELRLSSATNMGILPTRLQAALLGLYIFSNLVYCLILDYRVASSYELLAELRGRSGVLAVANMAPLVLLAGRNNPLIAMLRISFDTYNLLHRWIGRVVAIQSIVHTAAWTASRVARKPGRSLLSDMQTPYLAWGGIGVAAVVLMALFSPSPLRHAFYETFLNIHILLAIFAVAGIHLHCSIKDLPPLPYVTAAAALWIMERLLRLAWTLRRNITLHVWTTAEVTSLPGDACRVTLRLPRATYIKPGTHAYLRFARLNIWESHPFSIAWIEEASDTARQSTPGSSTEKDVPEPAAAQLPIGTRVSFTIQAKTGLTRRLLDFSRAEHPTAPLVYALFEGPYAGHHSLDSYGHVLLFAGSSGITHQLLYVRHLLRGHAGGTVATRRIMLVWAVRDRSHVQWAEPWLSTLLEMASEDGVFYPRIYVTRPVVETNPAGNVGIAGGLPICDGRPDFGQIVDDEVSRQVGAMCVTVCGPGGMADDVRFAVRAVQEMSSVDFIEESFSW